MIREFILEDNCDSNYSDLIIFDKDVNLKKLMEVIQKKKDEMPGEYTNEDIYELLLKKLGKPRLTVVLTANEETVIRRLQGRDPHDSDIKKAVKTREICERMIFFCEKFSLPYLVVDTSDMTPDEVANHIIAAWEKCE